MSWIARGKVGLDVALFPGLSLPKYEKAFNVVSKELDIKNLRITPHLARHSVASFDSLHKIRNKDEIRVRGHWKCPKSVDRYEKPGRMLIQNNRVPDRVWLLAENTRAECFSILKSHYK